MLSTFPLQVHRRQKAEELLDTWDARHPLRKNADNNNKRRFPPAMQRPLSLLLALVVLLGLAVAEDRLRLINSWNAVTMTTVCPPDHPRR